MGHALTENRNGLVVDSTLTHATGTAEREATLTMLDRRGSGRRITLGADKAYDVADFIGELRGRRVIPHIAVNGTRRSTAIDGRTMRHPGYEISLQCRKRIEDVFGWVKASAGLTKFKLKGLDKTKAAFSFFAAAYNLVRLPKLLNQ
jgi:IS5 family transposase